GSTVTYPKGWNLVSFADSTSFTPNAVLAGPLYTLDASGAYTTTDLQHVAPGVGYWAYFSDLTYFTLLPSRHSDASVTAAPGQCMLVGNPSTSASARVMGADRVLTYSSLLSSYAATTLLPIGRGAWACNDSAAPETVRVVAASEVLTLDWPGCCAPAPYAGGGQARLVFENDSPYPLTFAAPPIDAQGNQVDNGILPHGALVACGSCAEYAPGMHADCSGAAETASLTVPPGRYLLHLQSDAAGVADLQSAVDVQADTSYVICFFVTTDRQP
ncbi:MAG TPA: hypothetical protein VFA70_02710, partial [Dehalococcoidia bacterium]|nr:hypothetical protein [Dehalococcoidia bacterium]